MINRKVLLFLIGTFLFFPPGCKTRQQVTWPGGKAESIAVQIVVPGFKDKTYNIADFGAVADGITLNTIAINTAISECSKTGGGKVVVPKGIFLTGAIHLLDNVNLHLDEGAELRFSTNPADYLPVVKTSWEGILCFNYSPLIYAADKKNIAITGQGLLNGMASEQFWWPWKGRFEYGWNEKGNSQLGENARPLLDIYNSKRTPVPERVMGDGHFLRPHFIQFYQCENILVDNISISNSPFWVIHPVFCNNLTVRDVKINSLGPNNDGCDPESSKNILIEGCIFNTGDDCIALKSGRNEDGREINLPVENVVIRNCKMKNGHGGVSIGSEISGGVKNIFVENCEMDSPLLDRAIRIKTNNNRGGVTDSVFVRNIKIGQVREAVVLITCLYDPNEGQGNYPPVVKNIFIDGITSKESDYALSMEGLAGFNSIENIYIENSVFSGVSKPNKIANVKNLTLKKVKINNEYISGN